MWNLTDMTWQISFSNQITWAQAFDMMYAKNIWHIYPHTIRVLQMPFLCQMRSEFCLNSQNGATLIRKLITSWIHLVVTVVVKRGVALAKSCSSTHVAIYFLSASPIWPYSVWEMEAWLSIQSAIFIHKIIIIRPTSWWAASWMGLGRHARRPFPSFLW